jgi:hypothetical protein
MAGEFDNPSSNSINVPISDGQLRNTAMNIFLQTIAILGAATAAAATAEPGPACAPILSAMAKTLETDHATLTQSNGLTTNGITAGGVI